LTIKNSCNTAQCQWPIAASDLFPWVDRRVAVAIWGAKRLTALGEKTLDPPATAPILRLRCAASRAQTIDRYVPEWAARFRIRAAVKSHVLEHAIVHPEQKPPLAAHLEGELNCADEASEPSSGSRHPAAGA
jgi:hypothetical protein